MEKQLDNYVIQKRLAAALFGDVLLCEHRPTGERVAVKRVLLSAAAEKKTLASKKRVRENVAFERELYHKFRAFGNHRNVLALRDEIEFDGYLYMIFDYCARGELYEIVSGAADGKLDVSTTRDYLTQIASGVHFMHSNGFAHRDLSLENVLVTDDNTCKVCDFGLAAVADQPSNETVGKMFYMAPEVLSASSYDPKKADVWSLGVMLFIMLFGAPPVESAAPTDARFKIISTKGIRHLIGRWGLTDSVPAEAVDLIEGMIQVDPRRRLSIDCVLAHPFVNVNGARTCVVDCVDDIKANIVSSVSPASTGAVKENRLASKLQRLFRRSSKRRIMDVSATQTTVVA